MFFHLFFAAATLTATIPATALPKGLILYQKVNYIGLVQLHDNLSTQQAYIAKKYFEQMKTINGRMNRQFMATPQRIENKYVLGGTIYHDLKKQFIFHGDTFFMDRNEQ